MKDAYSFDLDEAGARRSYQRMFVAYLRMFARMGLKALPMRADTGPIGGELSHEFIVLADTGESAVFCDSAMLELPVPGDDVDYGSDLSALIEPWTQPYAATEDVHDAQRFEREVPGGRRTCTRGIEVGQIFYYGTKYSEPMRVLMAGADGVERPVHGGCYGVGVSRLLGAIIEACHDDAGIVWPDTVAPFDVGLVNLKSGDAACDATCERLYAQLQAAGASVLYDDTDERAGAKFSNMDLVGLPWQLRVGPRGLARDVVELKRRASGECIELTPEAATDRLASFTGPGTRRCAGRPESDGTVHPGDAAG
jgi:prolyl-tRNA synthetase